MIDCASGAGVSASGASAGGSNTIVATLIIFITPVSTKFINHDVCRMLALTIGHESTS